MNDSIFSVNDNMHYEIKKSNLKKKKEHKKIKIIINFQNNLLENDSKKGNINKKSLNNKKPRTNNKSSQTNNKLGRKIKGDNENNDNINNHNSNSPDNLFYKLKVNCMKYILLLLNSLLIKNKIKGKFMRIEGKIIRDGTKIFNLHFLNSSIKTILINYPLSKKYKINEIKENNNNKLIETIEKSKFKGKKIIFEILNKTFYEIYDNEYIKFNDNQYYEKYNIFKNKYLLYHHSKNQKCIKDFVNYGILSYLNKKRERKTIYKEYFKNSFQ